MVTVSGYTNATFTPAFRNAFLNTLATSIGVSNQSISITSVSNGANGDVVVVLEGAPANITAAVQGSTFLQKLKSAGLTAVTAVHVVHAVVSTLAQPTAGGVPAIVWAIVAVGSVAVIAAVVWVYLRHHSHSSKPPAPGGAATKPLVRLTM